MKKMRPKHIMVIVAMSLAIAASIGMLVNIGGLFFSPIANELGVGRGSVSLTLTIATLVCAVGGTVMPKIMNKKNFRLVCLVCAIITAGATALLGTSSKLWMLYALNAVRGFTAGFIGSILGSMVLTSWFHTNTGLVTSIALGFSGVAGALLSPIFSSVISSVGWRTAYVIAGVVMFILYMPLFLLPIGMKPEDVGEIAYGDSGLPRQDLKMPEKKDAAKTKFPLVLFLCAGIYAAMCGSIVAIVQHFPGVAESFALPASVGAVMLSASMIVNTSGKILLGFLIDRLGVRRSVLIYLTIIVLGTVLLLTVHTGPTAIIAAAFIGFDYALSTVSVVMLVREVFGMANYSNIYPKVALFCTASNAFGTTIVGLLYDHFQSYIPVLIVMLLAQAVQFTMFMILVGKKRVRV